MKGKIHKSRFLLVLVLKMSCHLRKKARGRRHHIRVYNTGILLATSYPNQAQNIDKFMTRCDQASNVFTRIDFTNFTII